MGIKLESGYEMQTTFWMDFCIAELFGVAGVQDTFNKVFNEWKDLVVYGTELAIVMNLKCWYWYDKGNMELSQIYHDYYYQVRAYCLDHYKGEDFEYYWRNTD